MAQLSFFLGLSAIPGLPLPFAFLEPKEGRARPSRAGDLARNGRQALVGLVSVEEPALGHGYPVGVPLPIPKETGAGFDLDGRDGRNGARVLEFPRHLVEPAFEGAIGASMGVFLHAIGDGTKKERPTHAFGHISAIELFESFAQILTSQGLDVGEGAGIEAMCRHFQALFA